MTDTHLVAFDPASDAAGVQSALDRVVASGGELVVVAGGGVIVRASAAAAESLAAHPAVAHVGGVTLPARDPVRIRRPAASDSDTGAE